MKRKLFRLLCLSILWTTFIGLSNAGSTSFSYDVTTFPVEALVSIFEGNEQSYICQNEEGYGCNSSNAYMQTKSDSTNKYFICPGDSTLCNSSRATLVVKKITEDIQYETYYVCRGNEQDCTSYGKSLFKISRDKEEWEKHKYYICSGTSSQCSSTRSFLQISKDVIDDDRDYYICDGKNYSCSRSNSYYKISRHGTRYYLCNGNTLDCDNSNALTQISLTNNSNNSSNNTNNSSNNTNNTNIIDNYFNNIEICQSLYGEHATVPSLKSTDCVCEIGYTWNSLKTYCVLEGEEDYYELYIDEIVADLAAQWNDFTGAYNFAFANGITTMETMAKADMKGTLDRIAMAKMIGNYAVNILGLVPDVTQTCYFPDVPADVNVAYDNGVTKACQLGLMGQGITDFRPRDKVTRAEFATVLSRLINRNSSKLSEMNSANPYFSKHMEFLKDNYIINSAVALGDYDNEIRGYVMLMLMRADDYEHTDERFCSEDEMSVCMEYFDDDEEYDECVAACKGE